MKPLTRKQQRFVEEYLIDLNATQAAIRAGYSKKTAQQVGSENLGKPVIKGAINEAYRKRSAELQVDAAWVLRKAVEMHKMASGEKEVHIVTRDGIGDGLTETRSVELKKTDIAGMGKALELIGKHVGVGAFEKDTAQVSIQVINPFAKKTDSDN